MPYKGITYTVKKSVSVSSPQSDYKEEEPQTRVEFVEFEEIKGT
jgi:hypothetical protein